jgi:two-component sensor histidine kinase
VPPTLVAVAIGISFAVLTVAIRVALGGLLGDRVPYALNFVAVVLATVAAGWRAGLVALVLSQALIWLVVAPNVAKLEILLAFVVATASEAMILVIIALYQREIDKGVRERERRLALLDHALNEIDHRTRNNHQTVLALIHLQAQRATTDDVKDALNQVADRIQAIAHATEKLALRSGDLERVRLDDHLCGLCEQIERGLSTQHVQIECRIDEITTTADQAIPIAIIVNELVTNALKHAFDGREQGRVRVTGRMNGALKLSVTDNGVGIKPGAKTKRGGLGTKLVDSFAKQLGARHEVVSTGSGTTHELVIPRVG